MRRTSINVWVLATVLPLLAGCPGSTLKKELSGIKQTIDTARKNGAYLCAPVELAMAESHYDFTAADLYYGDYFSAKDNVAVTAKLEVTVAAAAEAKVTVGPRMSIDLVNVLDTEFAFPAESVALLAFT